MQKQTMFLSDQIDHPNWPLVDIYQNSSGWLVKCDLAGVRRDEIRVLANSSQLTVSGIRRDWMVTEGHRAYSIEINYSRFSRTIELPCDLSKADMKVEYRDGMLLILITGCATQPNFPGRRSDN